jgi:hypothetical protein
VTALGGFPIVWDLVPNHPQGSHGAVLPALIVTACAAVIVFGASLARLFSDLVPGPSIDMGGGSTHLGDRRDR